MPAKKTPSQTARPARKRAPAKPPVAAGKAPVEKPLAAASAPATVPAAAEKKLPKQRVRLVRDSFTMPEPDFALIATLKGRALAGQREAKKSEILRAGLQVLMTLDGQTLISALQRLQPLKLGRPKKGH